MTKIEEIAAAFDDLELPGHDPKWSSWILQRLITDHLTGQRYSISDLFQGFDLALRRSDSLLNSSVANLIKDLVRVAFLEHRLAYNQANWDWVNLRVNEGIHPAQGYLFLLALPPDQATPTTLLAILHALEKTIYFSEALDHLADDIERSDVQRELQHWRANGVRPEVVEKLSFLSGTQI